VSDSNRAALPEERDSVSSEQPAGKRSPAHFSLLSLMLLIAVVACWSAFWQSYRKVQQLRLQLPALRDLHRELEVDDPTRFAAVRKLEAGYDDLRWEVYLPEGHDYRLSLATDDLPFTNSSEEFLLPAKFQDVAIAAGRRSIELLISRGEQAPAVRVEVNGTAEFDQQKAEHWTTDGSRSGGSLIQTGQTSSTDEPLVLFRQFFEPKSGAGFGKQETYNGVMLWIEQR
jgi:hypothetical protein